MRLRTVRIGLWGAVSGVGVMLAGAPLCWAGSPKTRLGPVGSGVDETLPLGGALERVDRDEGIRTWDDLRGQPVAVFFGSTHCQDICATTLGEPSVTGNDLDADGGRGDDLQVALVTGEAGHERTVMKSSVGAHRSRGAISIRA